jgi:hypothetical protein
LAGHWRRASPCCRQLDYRAHNRRAS